jgi:hypothetical protein
MLKQKRWGVPQTSGQNAVRIFLVADFENTITASIFVGISIMTTFWKSCGHSASNGIDLAEIWALCQKITALKLGRPQNM